MIIDIICGILLVLAIWKGFQRGLVIGIFSFLAIIIGLAAALKLSVVAANYLGQNTNISGQWLPVISFLAVFIIVIILVRLGAKAIEKSLEFAALGWLNRIGGIIFFVLIYMTIYSVALFYIVQLGLVKKETLENSFTYPWLELLAPKMMEILAFILPFLRDMFTELQEFFGNASETKAG